MSGEIVIPTELLSEPDLRINCTGFARIQDEEGRYALIVNEGRKRQGSIVLTPIGGSIALTNAGKTELETIFGARNFEKDTDMRFLIDGSKSAALINWFLTREGREIDPLREVWEELVEEDPQLLASEHLDGTTADFLGFYSGIGMMMRGGQQDRLTMYLSEVSKVVLPPDSIAVLRAKAELEPWVYFVEGAEIESGYTQGGIEIPAISKALLHPQDTIVGF